MDNPTYERYWRPLGVLQQEMEETIARQYAELDVAEVRPRFTYPLIRLSHTGSLTIRALAERLDITYSAASQTVAALRAEGLVDTTFGPDARTRVVGLTRKGRHLVPLLAAEWQPIDEAAAELDAELPFGLDDYVAVVRERLAKRSFTDRITARLDHPGAPGREKAKWA